MKILVAIESNDFCPQIFKKTMRWIVRTGFAVRVFVPPDEIEDYREGARDANYQNFLTISDGNFVDAMIYSPESYAEAHGYDLILFVDDDVSRPFDGMSTKREDLLVIDFAVMVGKARVEFGKNPDMMEKDLTEQITMQRVDYGRSD